MQNAPMRMNNPATRTPTRAKSVRARSPDVLQRQLHRLSEVYWQHPEYYRAALRPTITELMHRIKEAQA